MAPTRGNLLRPIAETIAVGSELLVGGRSDSNSLFIAEELSTLGLDVRFKSIVGDDESDIVALLKTAARRARVVIMTGGLGPTVDDCTREAVSKATGCRLARRKDAFDMMRARIAQWGRTPNKGQLRQGLIPAGAIVLPNPVGSAPGFILPWRRATIVALPGVPREMEPMLREGVLPYLREQRQQSGRGGYQPRRRLVFHTYGLPEADVDAKLRGLVPKRSPVELGMLASPITVLVSLTTKAGAAPDSAALHDLADGVRSRLGRWIYGEGDDSMESVVGRLLIEQRRTVAVAESCTGGLIGHRLTQVPGSSAYLDRGVICYSNKSKTELLGVPAELIERHGAVSAEVAAAMAQGICERSGVSVGISVTGIAGPGGATPTKPVGLVFAGLHGADGASATREFRFHGDRTVVKQRASQAALNLLREWLLGRQSL